MTTQARFLAKKTTNSVNQSRKNKEQKIKMEKSANLWSVNIR